MYKNLLDCIKIYLIVGRARARRVSAVPPTGKLERRQDPGRPAACSMLTQSGVEHWLDFGSLLGLMREGNILEGDTDVDISVVDTPENVEKLEKSRAPLADMGIFLKKELTWNAYRAASSLGSAERLPPQIREDFEEFGHCTGCEKVYWAGSHYDRMRELIAAL